MPGIIVTGSGGMLGGAFIKILEERGEDFVGLRHAELDITDRKKVIKIFSSITPSFVIHAAAWTDVDGCEKERDKAFLVNETGTENVVMACMKNKTTLVYLSTDFVFDGKKNTPYIETDVPNPINIYGSSKLAGEEKVRGNLKSYFIIRSSWLFGPGRANFVTKVLALAEREVSFKIVEDQVGTPTYTKDLACSILELIRTSSPGLYHITNNGSASRYEWGRAILEYIGLKREIVPIKYRDFSEIARRPLYSVLGTNRPRLNLPHWRDALKDYLKTLRLCQKV